MAFSPIFQTPGPSFSTTPGTTPSFGGFGTPLNDHNSGGLTWGPSTSTNAESSCHPSTSSAPAAKLNRFKSFTPLTSSPLARVRGDYSMEDDEDEDAALHEPSSPLGRMTSFNIGSSTSSHRRSDENESPLIQRRRAQYKSIGSSGGASRRVSSGSASSPAGGSRVFSTPAIRAPLFGTPKAQPEDPRRVFFKEKFMQRCAERAAKAREKAVKAKRVFDEGEDGSFVTSSMDASDDEGDGLDDELFRRLMCDMDRRIKHSYRVSYQNEVGSSFDPDMEDVARWEEELQAPVAAPQPPPQPTVEEFVPEDVEAEFDPTDELEAYADEYARIMEEEANRQQQQQQQSATLDPLLAGLEDVPEEELFGEWNFESEDVDMQM